ncbi:MAG: 16S rRNA (guanine(527)-N(7))-methyltransferase RsmG [Henriciella sp.]|nr:16S rRNA (guanine(527)-N(7))-methyltransferase RsmG [Henriciella sp.]
MRDEDGFGPDDLKDYVDVSRETLDRLQIIVGELDGWRRKTNLIGPAEFGRVWRRHVLDSIQLQPHIPATGHTIDLGSGSGFPALILAACASDPDARFSLVESVGKKCAFLRAAIQAADLPAKVIQGRVEAIKPVHADCITARAFAPLPKLIEYAEPWFAQGAYGVIPKGRRWEEELTDALESWRFAYEAIPSVSGDGAVLKISEVSRVER